LNIFTGYNGRGKSSVFQTLLLLGQSFIKNGDIEKLEVNGNFVRLDLFEDLLYKNSSAKGKDKMFFKLDTDISEYSSVVVGY
jgi:AAA15 family ATPase/GTPase